MPAAIGACRRKVGGRWEKVGGRWEKVGGRWEEGGMKEGGRREAVTQRKSLSAVSLTSVTDSVTNCVTDRVTAGDEEHRAGRDGAHARPIHGPTVAGVGRGGELG